ncbi:putative phosphoenolpyruvate synthase [Nymphon striatum]|nr:putative phosphoenolpyruvate synthase [Nymphon striatum]
MKISKLSGSLIRVDQHLVHKGIGSIHFGYENDVLDPVQTDSLTSESIFSPEKVTSEETKRKNVLLFTDSACTNSALTGGKGSSLAILSSISEELFVVPQGFCITISAYDDHLQNNPNIVSVIKDVTDVCSLFSTELEEEFIKSKVSSNLKNKIEESLNSICGDEPDSKRFAVRSSALGEDGEELSCAGQMETFLGCKGINQIFETVKKCWASLFGFKAIEYRRQNGQVINIGMCVVVQEMVAAEAAGVMFTRDPRTGSPQTMSIASNHGLGESVVSAAADPDDITVGRAHDGALTCEKYCYGQKSNESSDESSISCIHRLKICGGSVYLKPVNIISESEGIETVANELADKQCSITNEQILILAQIGVYVEKKYGDARDIEWAMSNGKPYLLQSRPITSLYQMTDSEYINEYNTPLFSDNDMISSGNVKEVLPGALSPLWNTYFDECFVVGLDRLGGLFSQDRKPNWLRKRTTFSFKWHRFFNRTEQPLSYLHQILHGYSYGCCQRVLKVICTYLGSFPKNWVSIRKVPIHNSKRKYGRTFNMGYQINDKYRTVEAENISNGFDIALNGRVIDDVGAEEFGIQRHGYIDGYFRWENYFGFMKVERFLLDLSFVISTKISHSFVGKRLCFFFNEVEHLRGTPILDCSCQGLPNLCCVQGFLGIQREFKFLFVRSGAPKFFEDALASIFRSKSFKILQNITNNEKWIKNKNNNKAHRIPIEFFCKGSAVFLKYLNCILFSVMSSELANEFDKVNPRHWPSITTICTGDSCKNIYCLHIYEFTCSCRASRLFYSLYSSCIRARPYIYRKRTRAILVSDYRHRKPELLNVAHNEFIFLLYILQTLRFSSLAQKESILKSILINKFIFEATCRLCDKQNIKFVPVAYIPYPLYIQYLICVLQKLANAIRQATGKEKFTSMSKEEAVKWLTSNNSPVKNDYDEFIFRHGHRCIKEFDPISKPWCMDPSKLIAPLCATLNNDNVKYKKKLTIDEALKNLKTPLTSKQKKKLRDTVLKARQFVAYREQAKSLLIRTCHEMRKGFIRLGELMVLDGRLPDAELVMFMSHSEIKTLTYNRSAAIIQKYDSFCFKYFSKILWVMNVFFEYVLMY